tara:strand:+ start:521 stop:805 length:285 start_codon:yes stop_codon:yes gene_type:complete
MPKKIRSGAGYSWNDENDFIYKGTSTHRSTRGFSVDNLDTKSISQAENNYEEVFIRVRQLLEDKPWCCDSRADVLTICQVISDSLKENLLIRKD